MSNITPDQYQQALQDELSYFKKLNSLREQQQRLQQEFNLASATDALDELPSLSQQITSVESNISMAEQQLEQAQATVFDFENQVTLPSQSDIDTQEKYSNASVSNADEGLVGSSVSVASSLGNTLFGRSRTVPKGALPAVPPAAGVNNINILGNRLAQDTRVKIRVPESYWTPLTRGSNQTLQQLRGIIFPYTPEISYSHKADYASQSPMHSNFSLYFYKNSSISPISIAGKFTVSNEQEAAVYVATVHLLRSLVKMKSGGSTGDSDSGAPPPVCRLDAYGSFMLQNVPVVISEVSFELPVSVDYYTLGKDSRQPGTIVDYELTSVPVISTIRVNCIPVYSRAEIQKFSVKNWLGQKETRKQGFL